MDNLRLFLHALAASVWVGGQITMGGLVPTIRTFGEDAPRTVARAFNRVAWPAFALVFFTGIWNLFVVLGEDSLPSDFHPWFEVKFLLFLVSGAGAAVHVMGRSKLALAAGGAASTLGGVGAMFLGFVIS